MGWDGGRAVLTHRQYLVWNEWIEQQWNVTDRHDDYLMQIACEVRRSQAKNPRAVKLEDFKLEYGKKSSKKKSTMTKEQATAASKARWLGMMTKKPVVVLVPPPHE